MGHARGAILITVVTILSLCSCSRATEPGPRSISANSLSGPDAGTNGLYVISANALERFIRYQDRVLELQVEMLPELSRREHVDGAAATVSVIRRQAEAEDRIRRELGLTERDVEQLEAIVGDVISRRARLSIDDAQETLWEMESLAARLPAEQRAEFDATVVALRRKFEQSRELVEERERYGVENVERILTREKELTEQWNRAIALFSGADLQTSTPAAASAAPPGTAGTGVAREAERPRRRLRPRGSAIRAGGVAAMRSAPRAARIRGRTAGSPNAERASGR